MPDPSAKERQRNTIPLVEPRYCDTIVVSNETIGSEQLPRIIARISGRQVEPSFVATYRYFLHNLFRLYSVQKDTLLRTHRGSFVARQQSVFHRKYAWLAIVSRDEAFIKFYQFTSEPKTKDDIVRQFNTASGRYLIRWGRWLGKTLFVPKLEAYQSFVEAKVPAQEPFWKMIVSVYERLAKESWFGTRRYNVAVGELRAEVCTRFSMLPLTFDCLLADLYQGRKRYTELELIGLPPHRLKKRSESAKLDPITVENAQYFYIVIHTQRSNRF